MSDLIALAERVEEHTAGDRGLDLEIAKVLAFAPADARWVGGLCYFWDASGQNGCVTIPMFTRSVDAVLALVAEKLPGWRRVIEETFEGDDWRVELWPISGGPSMAGGRTPALALLSATLRALANTPAPRVASSPQTADDEPGMPPTILEQQ